MEPWEEQLRQELIDGLLSFGGEAYEELGLSREQSEDITDRYIMPGLSPAVRQGIDEYGTEGDEGISVVNTARNLTFNLCRWADAAIRDNYSMYDAIKDLCAMFR